MMHITLICAGKLKEKHYISACAEYEKRLGPLCKLEVVQIAEMPEGPRALEREGEKILAAVPAGAAVVALCVEGDSLSSEGLAGFFEKCAVSGAGKLCFIIGSSNGLDEPVKRAAGLRLSMSAMTFPHHLARVMALEQIYRALMILAGSKYHK